jgi:hypothetical protein
VNDAELATSYRQLMVGQGGKTEQIVYAKPTRLLCFAVARPAFAAALAAMCEEAPRPTVRRDHDGRSFQ